MNPCNLMKALVSMRMSMKLNFFCLHPRSGIPRSSLKENDSATVVVHSLWLRASYWGTRGWTSLISKNEIKLTDPATPEQNGCLACRGYPAIWHCKIHGSAKNWKTNLIEDNVEPKQQNKHKNNNKSQSDWLLRSARRLSARTRGPLGATSLLSAWSKSSEASIHRKASFHSDCAPCCGLIFNKTRPSFTVFTKANWTLLWRSSNLDMSLCRLAKAGIASFRAWSCKSHFARPAATMCLAGPWGWGCPRGGRLLFHCSMQLSSSWATSAWLWNK